MAEIKDIVKLAVDGYKGKVEKYSVGQSQELLRQALIEANGGSTVLDYKKIRDGKCAGLFSLLEETLSRTVVEGLQGDEYFNALVDFRNVPEGDKNIFLVEDRNLFVVSEAADGTQGIRRQRLGGVSEASIPTSLNVYRIQFFIPKADFSGEFSLEMGENQTAHAFEAESLAGACGAGGSLWTYTVFGVNTADAE